MRMSFRAGVSALVLGCALPGGVARAETADDEHADEASESSSAAIAPIIVTARKREEDLQDIPVAVSVLTGEQLERAYIVNTMGVAAQVPSLNYSSANPRNTAFTIRGLGSSVVAVSQANDGIEPGVGFYVDQVYHARPATAAFDFSDVERVEVLRGPQGTLFGKNTTAGAITVTSRAPSFTTEPGAEFSLGENGYLQARASVSGPITGDTIAFRLSGLVTRRDGVIHNVVTGRDHNTLGTQSLRG